MLTPGQQQTARELGITIGTGTPGPYNPITNVADGRIGYRTIIRGRVDAGPDAGRIGYGPKEMRARP